MQSVGKYLTNPRSPLVVNLGLVVLLAYMLANLTWQFFPGEEADVSGSGPAPAVVNKTIRNSAQVVTDVVALHLFGNPSNPAGTGKASTINAPDTSLNLALKGVLAYEPQADALAIISQGNGEEKIYQLGDELPGNATLVEVYPNRVILDRGGHFETLRLPEEASLFGSGKSVAGSANTRIAAPVGDVTKNLSGISARELRDRIKQDPMAFARMVNFVPVTVDGKSGIKLRMSENAEVLQQYGLLPDDVIVEVNGIRTDNPQAQLRLTRELTTTSLIQATVLRNGTEVPISISMQ